MKKRGKNLTLENNPRFLREGARFFNKRRKKGEERREKSHDSHAIRDSKEAEGNRKISFRSSVGT